jgi:peptidoglycan/xylan/chitin deacetylase (PgdA/CDA1 family)
MTDDMPRDLIGYGRNPPHPRWPGDARIALNFVVNVEEGSEPSIQDGEGYSERGLTDAALSDPGVKGRDLAAEGLFAYGARVGFWRIARLLDERGLPATMFACAQALERNPEIAAYIRQSVHDVCCHGWRWVKHYPVRSTR